MTDTSDERELGIAGVGAYAPRNYVTSETVEAAWGRFAGSGVEHPHRGPPDVGPGAVALDERDDRVVGDGAGTRTPGPVRWPGVSTPTVVVTPPTRQYWSSPAIRYGATRTARSTTPAARVRRRSC